MTRPGDPPVHGELPESSLDAELGRILEAYLADLEAGRPVDPERLLAEHPALAEQLRSCLAVLNLAERVAGDSGPSASTRGGSALKTLGLGGEVGPRVHLRETPDEPEPMIRPRSEEMPLAPTSAFGRYQLQGEIARGGMGAVLKGRDVDLGRDLAIKVLLEAHRDHPDVVRRFVEEAQIGGQLQHPGIVPVYELGAFPDRRPYFAMKLVKGRTLAALLQERPVRTGPVVGGGSVPRPDRAGPVVGAGSVRRPGRIGSAGVSDGSGDGAPSYIGPDPAGRGTAALPTGTRPPTEALPSYDDLPRFLSIFEQVCQTMAYAHARGVIHRDLKPSNIMVGSFGEVQVMDWGLAKVLPQGGIADEGGSRPDQETVIMTVRSGPAGSDGESQAGSVLGTPSYMAPEQARGELDRIDERSDVFGLGAILCEILTGRPPFGGSTREEVRARAAQGNLADALGRLDACRAEAELVALAKHCLAAEPEHRPRDAGEVSRRISAYQAGVQDRLKAAELARVAAQTRAAEERKRRRVTVALAGSLLGLVVLGAGGWAYLARQRLERTARVIQALNEAEFLYAEARRAGDNLERWIEARDSARAVERLRADAPDVPTRDRMIALVRDVTKAASAAENDQRLLAKLVDIRSATTDDPDGVATDSAYADAFEEAGIDFASLTPAEAGARIQARPAAVRAALVAALDHWAAVLSSLPHGGAGALRLTEAARMGDPDPWRNRLRDLLRSPQSQDRLTILRDLAKSVRFDEVPAVSLDLLGGTLLDLGDPAGAETVLREAQRRYPNDVWLNYTLAECLVGLARREEAIRYYMVARSLRPEMAHPLAHALEERGETDQAIAVFQDLARLRHKDGRHLACLGAALKGRGRNQEATAIIAEAAAALRVAVALRPDSAAAHGYLGKALEDQGKLDEAIAEYRTALQLKPDYPKVHNNLGVALHGQGKLDEAIAEYRTSLRLEPGNPLAHYNLGLALNAQGKLDEAIKEHREAVRLKPDYVGALNMIGVALCRQGRLDEAIVEYRTALRLSPNHQEAHNNLGIALKAQGKLDEAIAEYRESLRLGPNYPEAHCNLGVALRIQKHLSEAIAEFRTTLRLRPDYPEAHNNLGIALKDQGKLDEAIAEYREALRLRPDNPGTHCNLGLVLQRQGKYSEALAALARGHEIGTKQPNWRYPSAQWVQKAERMVALDRKLPEVLKGEAQPADAAERLILAEMCTDKQWHAAAARFWSEAFQANGELAADPRSANRYNAACAAARAGCGQGQDDPPPDDAAKIRWRKQAIEWLRADLAAWTKTLESGPPQVRQAIVQTLQHWKADTDLAGLRDPGSVERLPKEEQAACRALWKAVDALLARSGGGSR